MKMQTNHAPCLFPAAFHKAIPDQIQSQITKGIIAKANIALVGWDKISNKSMIFFLD
jgi:hypothetical protein